MKGFWKKGAALTLAAVITTSTVFVLANSSADSSEAGKSQNTIVYENAATTDNKMEGDAASVRSNEIDSLDLTQYTEDKDVIETVNYMIANNFESTQEGSQTIKLLTMEDLNIKEDISSENEVMGRAGLVDMEEYMEELGKISDTSDSEDSAVKTAVSNFEVPIMSYGIDVSKWQGNINWQAVKASGISFAMVKIAGRSTGMDGELYIDPYADKNIREAQAAGIQVGVYFFSQATNVIEAYQEACLVVNLLKNYNITFPVAFDWESAEGYRVSYLPNNKAGMNLIASTFCNTVESYGYTPMIYACANDFYNTYDSTTLCAKYKPWLARYYNDYYYTSQIYMGERQIPMETFTYKMWQFGVSNVVAGIDGFVDMNLGFFTYIPVETPMSINVPVPVLNVPVGGNYNLMTGVSAVSHAGQDATAYVTYKVTNIFGVEVAPEAAYTVPGTYTVKYSLIDATGLYKQVCIPLIVG